jgi:5-methylcytosine-specific restriction endonuclease McrA
MRRFSTLRSYSRPKPFGRNAFRPERPLPPGRCTWCKLWARELDRDHVLPRDVFPGALRDAPPNLVPACRSCNRRRADGKLKPSFLAMPRRSQIFVLGQWRPARIARYFKDVPDEGEQGTPIR